ncbi:phosphodiester glycosidase family protein [Candidatus Woesebacteria bacterium]|nr:phosphodiester glycosidase family protein [Candidatus Woesebacteria bacterium]
MKRTIRFPFELSKNVHVIGLIKMVVILVLLALLATGWFILREYLRLLEYQATITKVHNEQQLELGILRQDKEYLEKKDLNEEVEALQKTFELTSKSYEELIKLNGDTTNDLEKEYAAILALLSKRNYASATAQIATLNTNMKKEQTKQAQAVSAGIPENVQTNNTPPGSGYKKQYVKNEYGTYLVDIIAADLNSSKVVVDTASDGTCTTDCPVMSVGDYASRSGAFAAINGPYFCPADYPSCADKKNSFDTLLMNKNKVYFNSDNNVYSNVPAVIFSGNSARFVSQSLQWGRDTGVDAVIAGQPLLLLNGNVVFGGDNEIKRNSKGSRSFIGTTGSTVYIGVVRSANVAEVAQVLKTMGIQNALNLDSGGSTALWNGGKYIAGPGRNLPFGILIVSK